jgi:hypothetical protein
VMPKKSVRPVSSSCASISGVRPWAFMCLLFTYLKRLGVEVTSRDLYHFRG